jgi:hypothetical protein
MTNDLASIVTAIILILFGAMAGYFMVHPESNNSVNWKWVPLTENISKSPPSSELNIEHSNIKIDGSKIDAGDLAIEDSANSIIYKFYIDPDSTSHKGSDHLMGLKEGIDDDRHSPVNRPKSVLKPLASNFDDRTTSSGDRPKTGLKPIKSIDEGRYSSSGSKPDLFLESNRGIEEHSMTPMAYDRVDNDIWNIIWLMRYQSSTNLNNGFFSSIKLYKLLAEIKNNIMKFQQPSSIISAIVLMLIGVYGMHLIASKK